MINHHILDGVPEDHVAGQHRAHAELDPNGLIGHFRIASAKDAVGWHIGAQLGFQSLLHLDFGQDAEAIGGKGLAGAAVDLVEGRIG